MMMSIAERIKRSQGASGFAIIISNDYTTTPRTAKLKVLKGPQRDAQKMDLTFKSLNIATHREHNVTKARLVHLMSQAAQCKDYPSGSKCIAFVFSGHGMDKSHIYMQDGQVVKVDDIIRPFLPEKSPTIGNIPKLFFIDACRGSERMTPVVVPKGDGYGVVQEISQKGATEVPTIRVPQHGNILIAYSTMPNYQSYESKKGSLWMTTLADKLRTSDDSVENILTAVSEEMVSHYQDPCYQHPPWVHTIVQTERISRLNKRVFLGGTGQASGGGVPTVTSPTRPVSGKTKHRSECSRGKLSASDQSGVITRFMRPSTCVLISVVIISAVVASMTSPKGQNPQPGYYRGELNAKYQNGEITKSDFQEVEHHDDNGGTVGYTSTVTFVVNATKKWFQKASYGKSKPVAQEQAAKLAVDMLGTEPKAYSSRDTTKQSSSSAGKQPSFGSPTKSTTKTASSPPGGKTAVTKLKEYCEQQHFPQPQYSELPAAAAVQTFQIEVTVKTPSGQVKARGDVCSRKHDAKESAAQKAINTLRI